MIADNRLKDLGYSLFSHLEIKGFPQTNKKINLNTV